MNLKLNIKTIERKQRIACFGANKVVGLTVQNRCKDKQKKHDLKKAYNYM